jgi:hypothetical protein
MKYILSFAMDFFKLYVIETGIFGYKSKKTINTPLLALIFTGIFIITYNLTKDDPIIQAVIELLYLLSNTFVVSTALEGRKNCLSASFHGFVCSFSMIHLR